MQIEFHHPYKSDLRGMSAEEAERELDNVQRVIDEETTWAEALQSYIDAGAPYAEDI